MGPYKAAYDFPECLMGMGLVADVGGGDSPVSGGVYRRYFLDLGKSETHRLEIPALTAEELSPASSRD